MTVIPFPALIPEGGVPERWQVRRRHHLYALCRYARLGHCMLANVMAGQPPLKRAPLSYSLGPLATAPQPLQTTSDRQALQL